MIDFFCLLLSHPFCCPTCSCTREEGESCVCQWQRHPVYFIIQLFCFISHTHDNKSSDSVSILFNMSVHTLQSSVERADSNGAEETITKTERTSTEKSERSGTKKKTKKSKKSADSEKENISVVNGNFVFFFFLSSFIFDLALCVLRAVCSHQSVRVGSHKIISGKCMHRVRACVSMSHFTFRLEINDATEIGRYHREADLRNV